MHCRTLLHCRPRQPARIAQRVNLTAASCVRQCVQNRFGELLVMFPDLAEQDRFFVPA
jgi:hypothetical protein